jgi:hypothetical protein
MAALTKDVILPRNEGDYADFPVAAATKIFEGALVGIDASGFAINLLAAEEQFVGVAHALVDNTGAAGDLFVKVRRDAQIRQVALAGAVQADVGKTLYATDNATFTLTPATASPIGRVHAFISAGVILALLKPDEQIMPPQADSGAAPTQSEFNALLDKLRNAGLMRKT